MSGADATRDAVRTVVTRLVHTIDFRRWTELRALFADEVTTDYTSLFGGEVQRQRADDLIAAWRTLLTPLEATQHLLGPIDVRIDGSRTVAECHVRGYHLRRGVAGGDEWMVAGHYVIELTESAGVWLVQAMTLRTLYERGNRGVLGGTALD